MPVLTNNRKTTRIILPSMSDPEDPGWVEIRDKLILGDFSRTVTGVGNTRVEAVAGAITDWNMTDEDGTKLPITVENVGLLEADDFNILWDHIQGVKTEAETKEVLSKDEKKASTSSLMPNLKVENRSV